MIRAAESAYLDRLKAYFPGGEVREQQQGSAPYYVPASANQVILENETSFTWSDQVELIGWATEWHEDRLAVTLAWQAGGGMSANYTAFVHLLDESGEVVSQVDRPPLGYPTGEWRPGEVVVETFILP